MRWVSLALLLSALACSDSVPNDTEDSADAARGREDGGERVGLSDDRDPRRDGGKLSSAADSGEPNDEALPRDAGDEIAADSGSTEDGAAGTIATDDAGAGSGGSHAANDAGETHDAGDQQPSCSAFSPCVLAELSVPPSVKRIMGSASQVNGAITRLNNSDPASGFYLATEPPAQSTFTNEFSVASGDADVTEAADYLRAVTWQGNAAFCVAMDVGVSGVCWRIQNQHIDLRDKTITSFVAIIDTYDIDDVGGEVDAMLGGRWEIWGY